MALEITDSNYREIEYHPPLAIFDIFCDQAWAIFFDSADAAVQPDTNNHYSYIALNPFQTMVTKNHAQSPFDQLNQQLQRLPLKRHPALPPFQGGLAGYFGYDLFQHLEPSIALAAKDDFAFADLAVGFYDLVISFDHRAQKAWIVCPGFAEQDAAVRQAYVEQQLTAIENKIKRSTPTQPSTSNTSGANRIISNFTRQEYINAIYKTIDYIHAGDIFETNLSQRFSAQLPETLTPYQLYKRLRRINPAPFAAFINLKETSIVSASPERFLKLDAGCVETRPIKGTRPRSSDAKTDADLAADLLNSSKDHAENTMIVDLMRNDLARVCDDHSIQVPQFCHLESFANVHHLVSVVTGQLRAQHSAIDLLKATFPGGSITGAPKVRAMQIISELEPTQRGPYCGTIGYIGFDGSMDCAMTIRTYAIKNHHVSFQTGGAIVADSNPIAEYEETLIKAEPLQRALTQGDR